MIKLDTNDKKKLRFDVQIAGIDSNLLEGALRLVVDGVEYGFPATFSESSIEINVPALANVIKELKEDTVAKARLDVYGNGYYINPWKEDVLVKNSVQIKAQIHQESKKMVEETGMPEISCSVVVEEVTESHHETKEQVSAAAGIGSGAYETPHTPPVKDAVPVKRKEQEKEKFIDKDQDDSIEGRSNAVLQKVKDKLDKMKVLEKKKTTMESKAPVKKKKSAPIKEAKKKPVKKEDVITEVSSKEDIYRFMASRGMKNEKIQRMLMERAEDVADADNIEDIFEAVKKMLTTNQM